MPSDKNDKQQMEIKITDRRRFTEDAMAKTPVEDSETEQPKPRPAPETGSGAPAKAAAPPLPPSPVPPPAAPSPAPPAAQSAPAGDRLPVPSPEQRAESSRAYKESVESLDERIRRELGGQALGSEFKVGFDRIVEPLYVTALVQLGFMGQEGQQRRVDIIGARQSIDAINLLQEKTEGNLASSENELLEDILYDLRMKYLEITNALARAVHNPPEGSPNATL